MDGPPEVDASMLEENATATRRDASTSSREPVSLGIEGVRSFDRRMLDAFTHIRDVKKPLNLAKAGQKVLWLGSGRWFQRDRVTVVARDP